MWCGFQLDDESFWRKTPRQLVLVFAAHNATRMLEQNKLAWLAWHIAALSRAQRLPKFEKMLVRPSRPRQTWQEQMAIMDQWRVVMDKFLTHQKKN